uniref:aspartate dehydrogenase domain-containing protein n=1 Tax=Lonchura striata TaxID=40157 RepID=UPI000B4D7A32|nr:putative L-aspartate dehydrogenase [Lonchura striata domestica]
MSPCPRGDSDNVPVPQALTVTMTVSPCPQGDSDIVPVPQALTVTMTKAAGSFRARGWLSPRRLGFDGVTACLVADPSVPDCHLVTVDVTAVPEGGRALTVTSTRRNPAEPGHVTGSATRHSFWSSVLACTGHGGCLKLC